MAGNRLEDKLREILAADEAATAGPWRVDNWEAPPSERSDLDIVDGDGINLMTTERSWQKPDARLIALLRNNGPALARAVLATIETIGDRCYCQSWAHTCELCKARGILLVSLATEIGGGE